MSRRDLELELAGRDVEESVLDEDPPPPPTRAEQAAELDWRADYRRRVGRENSKF